MIDFDFLTGESQGKFVAGFPQPVDIGPACYQTSGGDTLARFVRTESAELNGGVGGKAEGTAILELNLSSTVLLRMQSSALDDGQIGKGVLVSQPRMLVDLHPALNIAQANDPDLRFSRGGARAEREGEGSQDYQLRMWLEHRSPRFCGY